MDIYNGKGQTAVILCGKIHFVLVWVGLPNQVSHRSSLSIKSSRYGYGKLDGNPIRPCIGPATTWCHASQDVHWALLLSSYFTFLFRLLASVCSHSIDFIPMLNASTCVFWVCTCTSFTMLKRQSAVAMVMMSGGCKRRSSFL